MPTLIVKEYHFNTDWPAAPAAAAPDGAATRPTIETRALKRERKLPLDDDMLRLLVTYLQYKLGTRDEA